MWHLQTVFQRRSLTMSEYVSTVSGIPSFPSLCFPAASTVFQPHKNLIPVVPSPIRLLLSLAERGCGGDLSTKGCHKAKYRCVISPMVLQKTILNFIKGWDCENMGFPFGSPWVGFSKSHYPILLNAVTTLLSLTRTCLLLRAGAATQPLLDQASAKDVASVPDLCCQPKLRFRQLALL